MTLVYSKDPSSHTVCHGCSHWSGEPVVSALGQELTRIHHIWTVSNKKDNNIRGYGRDIHHPAESLVGCIYTGSIECVDPDAEAFVRLVPQTHKKHWHDNRLCAVVWHLVVYTHWPSTGEVSVDKACVIRNREEKNGECRYRFTGPNPNYLNALGQSTTVRKEKTIEV